MTIYTMIAFFCAIGFIIAIGVLVAAFYAEQRVPKLLMAFCVVLMAISLAGFANVIDPQLVAHLTWRNTPAPLSSSTSLIFSQQDPATIAGNQPDVYYNKVTVYNVNASDGSVRWQHALYVLNDNSNFAAPIVSGNLIYTVGNEQISAFKMITALRVSDGTVAWHASSGGHDNATFYSSPPFAADGMLYVSVSSRNSSNQSRIYALHADNGSVAWSRSFPLVNKLSASNGLLAVYSQPGQSLFVLRSADGSLAWQAPGTFLLGMANGVIYTKPTGDPRNPSLNGKLVALQAQDGAPLWSQSFPIDIASLTISDHSLYLQLESQAKPGGLFALDIRDGTTRWQGKSTLGSPIQTVVEANGVIYTETSSTLSALRASDGLVVWQRNQTNWLTPSTWFSFLTAVNNVVFVETDAESGRYFNSRCTDNCDAKLALYALRGTDGSPYWRYSTTHFTPQSIQVA